MKKAKAIAAAAAWIILLAGADAIDASHAGAGFIAGADTPQTIIITNTFQYPPGKTLVVLYLTNTLPAGWKLTGNSWGPGTRDINTNFNEIVFLDSVLPTNNPLVFAYEVSLPSNQYYATITATIGYRFADDDDITENALTPHPLAPPMLITVAANPASKTYGQPDPALSYTLISGKPAPGDVFTGALARAAGTAVGAYEIRQGSLGINSNYSITFVPNWLTITPLPAVLSGRKIYDGTAAADYSILTVSNKVGNDDVYVAAGTGTLANTALGWQTIVDMGTLTLGGADVANYTMAGASGAVEITSAAVAPVILMQPASLTCVEGSSAQFEINATGTPPLFYQWQKDGQNISAATSDCYRIAATAAGDAGFYRCIVSNAGGITASAPATLTIITPHLPAPAAVTASRGDYTNKIRVAWQAVAEADSYVVWRHTSPDASRAVRQQDTSATSYDDYLVTSGTSYYYWVSAKQGCLTSPFSHPAVGYAALSPSNLLMSADLAADDLIFLPRNITRLSHAGVVSFRLRNFGPDTLTHAQMQFDFYMTACPDNPHAPSVPLWLGGCQRRIDLARDAEILVILTPEERAQLAIPVNLAAGLYKLEMYARPLAEIYDSNMSNNIARRQGCLVIRATGPDSRRRSLNDFEGDGKSDAVTRDWRGVWQIALSGSDYQIEDVSWPAFFKEWRPVPGDYDGDGITDTAVYHEFSGWWLVQLSSGNGGLATCHFGGPDWRPIIGDYDGDGLSDPALFNPSYRQWLWMNSSAGYTLCAATITGRPEETALADDYDGDGRADPVIYCEAEGKWTIALSRRQYQPIAFNFGGRHCQAIGGDYDGDGLSDPAFYHKQSGLWQVMASGAGYRATGLPFGDRRCVPVPADYDGDGFTDPAVYHLLTGLWQARISSRNYEMISGYHGGMHHTPVSE